MKIAFITNLAEEVVARGSLLTDMTLVGHDVVTCVSRASDHAAIREASAITPCRLVRLDRTGLNPFVDILYFHDLLKFLIHERPQVILCRAAKPVIYGSIAARLAGIRHVYSLITGLGTAFLCPSGLQGALNHVSSLLYRLALARNERVLFQNVDDLQLFLDRRLIRAESQAVLLNGAGVDLRRFQPAPLPGNITFLFIGRLLRQKGVREYVAAAKSLKSKYPNVRFILVGATDANPSSVSRAEAAGWARTGVVEWRGSVKDVRPCIAEASVFVLPSYREGSPRAVLEAMAMGRAIVTTLVPGCRDTVIDGVNGFLVPGNSTRDLERAIEKFILQPELAEVMGGQSRKLACARHDIRCVNTRILQTLGVLGPGVQPSPSIPNSEDAHWRTPNSYDHRVPKGTPAITPTS